MKTRFVAGGEEAWYRFPNLPARDGSSTLAYGGFRTDASALIGGFALAGMRWFRLDSGAKRNVVYADVSATWNISFKTKLGGQYRRDADYSSLAMSGPTPTNLGERVEAFVEKFLTRSVYLRLYARQYRLVSDGDVVLVPPEGGLVVERAQRPHPRGRRRARLPVPLADPGRDQRELHGPRFLDPDVRGRGPAGRLHAAVQPAAADVPVRGAIVSTRVVTERSS